MTKSFRKIYKNHMAAIGEACDYESVIYKNQGVILVYCQEGECRVGEEKLKAGDCFLLTLKPLELKGKMAKVIICVFTPTAYRENIKEFMLFPVINRKLKNGNAVSKAVEKLLEICRMPDWNSNFLVISQMYRLIYEISSDFHREKEMVGVKERDKYKKMHEIENYIGEHYSENITLLQLAEHYNYTESSMSRFFTVNFNMTFLEYYNAVRLAKAQNDLLFSELSISEIAVKNGFSGLRSFQRVFHKQNKMTPSEYRKNGKGCRFKETSDIE